MVEHDSYIEFRVNLCLAFTYIKVCLQHTKYTGIDKHRLFDTKMNLLYLHDRKKGTSLKEEHLNVGNTLSVGENFLGDFEDAKFGCY